MIVFFNERSLDEVDNELRLLEFLAKSIKALERNQMKLRVEFTYLKNWYDGFEDMFDASTRNLLHRLLYKMEPIQIATDEQELLLLLPASKFRTLII